jgi:hypothetical protein
VIFVSWGLIESPSLRSIIRQPDDDVAAVPAFSPDIWPFLTLSIYAVSTLFK